MMVQWQGVWKIFLFFRRVCELGLKYGYLLEEGKSMLIDRDKSTEKAENLRKKNESCFLIKNGFRYLGSFIGKYLETEWVEEKIENWRQVVELVVEMTKYTTQSAYAGMQHTLQQEWNLIKRVVPKIRFLFVKLEENHCLGKSSMKKFRPIIVLGRVLWFKRGDYHS